MNTSYRMTKIAAYMGYVTQAIVNNLTPLLFVTFSKQFDMTLEKISLLITINFVAQILTDLLSAKYISKIGYRPACVLAHALATIGLCCYAILPFVLPSFLGLAISCVLCAVGGGLDEVIISPVIEALPSDNKASDMSLLHSFFSWGQMAVVIGSTVFFKTIGIQNWRFLPIIWAVIPLVDTIMFLKVPILELHEDEASIKVGTIFARKEFWVLLIIMICAGASELAMSQWASMFAENGLHVSKTMGDLLGPCMFALFMAICRTIYGIKGEKMDLQKYMFISGLLCVVGYLVASKVSNPFIALMGCAVVGFSVGLMWPGAYSIGAAKIPEGGAKMFALLAFAGDVGCTSGPDVVGLIGDKTGSLQVGLSYGTIFPIVLMIGIIVLWMFEKKAKEK